MTLRIEIDGEWDAADFATFFKSLDDLHNYITLVQESTFYPEIGRVSAYGFRHGPKDARYRLIVKRIKFSSPGFTDIIGLASVMREIRELIQFLILFISNREDRKLQREKGKLEIAQLRLGLLRELYEIEKESGRAMPLDAEKFFSLKSNSLPDLDPLITAALEGRIKSVELKGEDTIE